MDPEDIAPKSQVDVKKLILRLYSFRFYYIIAVFFLMSYAYFKNKTAERVYMNSAQILIKESTPTSFLRSNDLMQGINHLSFQANIEDELLMINSFELVKATLNRLDFATTYFSKQSAFPFLKEQIQSRTELYKDSPIDITYDATVPQLIYANFQVKFISDDKFRIAVASEGGELYNFLDNDIVGYCPAFRFDTIASFGDLIKHPYFRFYVRKTPSFDKNFTNGKDLFFFTNHLEYLTLGYKNMMGVERMTLNGALVKVSISGTNYYKISDFLNAFIIEYIDHSLAKKNKIALSAIQFIDSQINIVSDSLSTAERNLKNYRAANKITDLSFQGQRLYERLSNIETEKAGLEDQLRYYKYLDSYITEQGTAYRNGQTISPPSVGAGDPLLNDLVSQLITAINDRNNIIRSATSTRDNIQLRNLEIQINNLAVTIRENVETNIENISQSIKESDYRISSLYGEISKLPSKEFQLLNFERKFELNNEIINFLLQRRSEAQIAMASNTPDYEIIEDAKPLSPSPIAPNTMLNYMVSIVLALFLPTGAILLFDFLNNKISSAEEIERMVKFPVMGRILQNTTKNENVFDKYSDSPIAESFRAVRSNFQFLTKDEDAQILLVTSSISKEGKSFCSLNLSSAFALNNSKTVLLEFDLRRPNLAHNFNKSLGLGLTTLLRNQCTLDDVIIKNVKENLDFIPAGPPAPNPAELINSIDTVNMLNNLREMYDIIIIDTAPIGVLAETSHLMHDADLNIVITRLNHITKNVFTETLKTLKSSKIDNIGLLINGIPTKGSSYKYKYDKNYYHKQPKKRFSLRKKG